MIGNNGAQAQTIQINPAECARFALVFLARADFKGNERQMFDLAESLLKAIAEGRVVVAPPPVQEARPELTKLADAEPQKEVLQ